VPPEVAGVKVHVSVSTTVPAGCSTVMAALVKDTLVIASVHLWLGQPGAPGIGLTGAFVISWPKCTVPFLICDCGSDCTPVSTTGAGFCPGGCFFPPGLVQVAVGFPVAERVTRMSPLPSPARSPDAESVRPLSVNTSWAFFPPFKWTLPAEAVAAIAAPAKNTIAIISTLAFLIILVSPSSFVCPFRRPPVNFLLSYSSFPAETSIDVNLFLYKVNGFGSESRVMLESFMLIFSQRKFSLNKLCTASCETEGFKKEPIKSGYLSSTIGSSVKVDLSGL